MSEWIRIRGARQNNLKNIDVALPKQRLVVITGPSGAGKSSLAFDTLYAEGQRRYVECLAPSARQFLTQLDKPDVDAVEGLSPAIAVEQRVGAGSPRSTVGTVSDIYDYLRLLFARLGQAYCYNCGAPIRGWSVQAIVDDTLAQQHAARLLVCAPLTVDPRLDFNAQLERLRKAGFARVRVDGETHLLEDAVPQPQGDAPAMEIVVDRLVLERADRLRLTEAVELALHHGAGSVLMVLLGDGAERSLRYSRTPRCSACDITYPELHPRLFSFNNPAGACPACHGLGTRLTPDVARIVPDATKSLAEGAMAPWAGRSAESFQQVLEAVAQQGGFSIFTPFAQLTEAQQALLLHGSGGENLRFVYGSGETRQVYERPFEGVVPYLARRLAETDSPATRRGLRIYFDEGPCDACGGSRLCREALHVRMAERSLDQVVRAPLHEARAWVTGIAPTDAERPVAEKLLQEIASRLGFLLGTGLDYLTLDRPMDTLSMGEAQRIRLATQLGAALSGVVYILDEPTLGLHQRDTGRLLHTLTTLRDAGNTVVVVEHDKETLQAADYLVEIGPQAGEAGGYLVAAGDAEALMANPASRTGAYLAGRAGVELPAARRSVGKSLRLRGITLHNLHGLDVEIPLRLLVCITGVSGSGKSTLALDVLYPALRGLLGREQAAAGPYRDIEGAHHLERVIHVDQSPIGRSSRSNPGTSLGVFRLIRDQFAAVPESRTRGYSSRRFSFNTEGGRCEACQGEGRRRVEMFFLPDVYVRCEVCEGSRYNRETLEIRYRGKTIGDLLEMPLVEVETFFRAIPGIQSRLQPALDVGLGYLRLGQPANTLSGGEAQRLKIARELGRPGAGPALYLLDEPTSGLHYDDVQRLLDVLTQLVAAGHSVVVIEHNLEFIKCADHLIDLGPEGGAAGGRIVAQGTPEQVAQSPETSHTGRFLAPLLAAGTPGGGRVPADPAAKNRPA
jgi:excinuclease ABC subunit A